MRTLCRLLIGVALLFGLAACDTFGLGGSAPTPPAARALDLRHDDLAHLVFALDLPTNLSPLADGMRVRFDAATPTGGARHLDATLVLADGGQIDGLLPPAASGRTYYLFTFAPRDAARFAEAEHWLAGLPADAAPVTTLNVVPRLCETASIDPAATTFSVIPALPGTTPLAPLVASQKIATLIGTGQLPPCTSLTRTR